MSQGCVIPCSPGRDNRAVPVRLRVLDPAAVTPAVERFRAGRAGEEDLRLLAKHFLAVLSQVAPGGAVEGRVPPYAAAQMVGGMTHKRGTPPAVGGVGPATRIRLAPGDLAWRGARAARRPVRPGERPQPSP